MGAYFSNLHIKKGDMSKDDVKSCLLSFFLEKGLVLADRDTADFEVNIFAPEDGRWISVYCDAFTHTDVLALCPRLSQTGGNDVLGVACFDSDYLFLNLCNAKENCDLWLNIGDSPELKKPRRSNLAAWKARIKNIDTFRLAAKKDYACAEEFLLSVQEELELPFEQSTGFEIPECVDRLYISAPSKDPSRPPKLRIRHFQLMPCVPGEEKTCFVNNKGAASRGLAILFVGDYVENEEITIENASFCFSDRRGNRCAVPMTFEKCRLSDGQWVYYWEDKAFSIPSGVSSDLPLTVQENKEFLNSFGIRYTPMGNKRKFLDITVVFAPLSHWSEGQCYWRVWARSSSKREYIELHNQGWETSGMPEVEGALLKPEEYDLD